MLNPNNSGSSSSSSNWGSRRPTDPSVGNGALPPGFQGTQNRAYTRAVQPDELSSNRMSAILDSRNPYVENARRRGTEQAASRGLLNSSMAAGTSQRAAIEAAQPMALQEAGAFGTAAGQNLDYLNQFGLEGMRDQRSEREGAYARDIAAAQSADRLQLQREGLAYEGEQRGLDRTHQNYRDATGYRYDVGRMGYENEYGMRRDNNNNRNDMQNYAFRTRTDMQAMPVAMRTQMMRLAMEDPETWTPENVAAFTDFYDQYYGDSLGQMDSWFDDFFGGY